MGVHLTKGQPAQSSTKLGHKMSTQGRGRRGNRGWVRGHLTNGHPAQSSTKLHLEMSTGDGEGVGALGGLGQGVHLTKGQPYQVVPNMAKRCLLGQRGH